LQFTLLKKKPIIVRFDVFPIAITALTYNHYFGEAVFDVEHLLAMVSLILAISLHSLFLLLNFWSVNANVFFGFSKLSPGDIANCTHVKIKLENKKQHTVKRYIVPIIANTVVTSKGLVNKTQ
jgi:hypothetical protein